MSGNTHQAFLEDILAHPDDDAPRLIFADWLEDEGDSDRAEFIRVQVERARLPEWDARQVRLRLREQELIKARGHEWKQDLPHLDGFTWGDFRRGFMATARFDSFEVLEEQATECWSVAPVEAVSISWPGQHATAERIPPLTGLQELSLDTTPYDPAEVERLAAAPLLSTLRVLNAAHSNLGVDGFRLLAASPYLGNLKALRLPANSIGNGGIDALLNAGSLTSLRELDLSNEGSPGRYREDPYIDAGGLAALATWAGLSGLGCLNLSGNDVGRTGLQELLGSAHIIGLKELVLRDCGFVGQAMLEFGFARTGLQLDVLDLGWNMLQDFGAENLAGAACLRELKVLTLDRCEIHSAGALELARASFLSSLRVMNVNNNSFGPEGVKALVKANPPRLHTLSLFNNDLGAEGASHLAESPASERLLELDLSQNRLEPSDAEAILDSPHLRNLLILRLNYNVISMEQAEKLARSPSAKRLPVVEIRPEDDIPF
jgi:uncharacterized protein (TIGR02996 family)